VPRAGLLLTGIYVHRMWFACPAFVLGTALLALIGLAIALRVGQVGEAGRKVARVVSTPTLVGSTTAVFLFTAHALVVIALARGDGIVAVDRTVLDWFLAHRENGTTAFMRAASFAGGIPATAVAVAIGVALLWWRVCVAAMLALDRRPRSPRPDHTDRADVAPRDVKAHITRTSAVNHG
jgi:hypothetical protein